ncbi:hypothetical protein IEO21_05607 [Rhodonia placenta]|uniref:assimilatory sulfite reductase (NADPH) n=1 Tax=Rhodonia placenta TaxID=104341 RepID=A0A8H7P1K7_9APHY|nr:hypothetical protein IEO21_05607 [Postia placenta]
MSPPSVRAVARIAFLASDALVSSEPPLPATSPFTASFATLASSALQPPRPVNRIPFGADPGTALLQSHQQNISATSLVSYVTLSHRQVLHHLLPHLAELSDTPTVLHVAIAPSDDLSDALVLRATVPLCIYSRSAQQAHDHALLASRIALVEGKAVLHIFHVGTDEEELSELDEGGIHPYLLAEKASPISPTSPSGHTNGFANGHANGTAKSRPEESAALYKAYESAAISTVAVLRRPLRALVPRGSSTSHTVIFTLGPVPPSLEVEGVQWIDVSLLKPLPAAKIAAAVPASAKTVLVCEQVSRWSVKWTPLFLEVVSALQDDQREERPVVRSVALRDVSGLTVPDVQKLLLKAGEDAKERLSLGAPLSEKANGSAAPPEVQAPHVPKHESSYTTLLQTLFGERLEIANDPALVSQLGPVATSPEFTLGRIRGEDEAVSRLAVDVKELLGEPALPEDLHALLSEWLLLKGKKDSKGKGQSDAAEKEKELGDKIAAALELAAAKGLLTGAVAERVVRARGVFQQAAGLRHKSRWIIGSDAWAYDLGASGLHHAIASGLDVNVLLLDTTPYSARAADPARRKQDVGLYAMNHGDVYVASVAVYASYAQVLQALVEADRFAGPSVVLAYLPVFGLGDSHYWPRAEDAHYYNKAGRDLDARLAQLGAQRVVSLGLGDDQDADGPETGYKLWEPRIWKALGVDAVEVQEAEPEPITNEHIKVASQYLRGTIKEGLADGSTGALAPSDTQLTKFHGIYQQDDRDIRDERVAQGAEPAYSFMIRVRMPGGVCAPAQWLLMDRIADEHGNGTFKITTRQTFQYHGVIKGHLKSAIQDINRALLDTLAACGDVNRNVIVSAIPSLTKLHGQAYDFAKRVSEHLLPRTTAYHEIWLDKKLVAGDALKDVEPLYGEFYLPRKFKVAVAVPPTNDVDIFANDLGFIAIADDNGDLVGFNVSAGGGMGVTHGNKKTYPRLGDVIGYCTVEQGVEVAEKIMLVQRDNGNREDLFLQNARLKYTIDRMGLENFMAEVERRLGYKLQAARPFAFNRNVDDYGWHTGEDGKHHYTCFIENGRVQDEPGREFKTCLREIAKVHKGAFRMTANQHLLITDIATEDLPRIKALLAEYKLDNLNHTGLRLSSSACVAFPTCGLAMAESERYLPILIDKVEKICEENGLRNDSIVMRMTGCPNGCARPYVAEVAFVGKAPGTYAMLLGGGYHGQRLNKIYRETVTEPEILAILGPMIKHYALERLSGEHFGDFVIRAGYIAATTEGKAWYDRMGGEGAHRDAAA